MNQLKAFIVCLSVFFVACKTTQSASPTPPISTPTIVPKTTLTQVSTPIPATPITPHPLETSPMATATQTAELSSTPSPEPSPTLKPLDPLTIRYPSMQEIKEYIAHIPVEYFHNSSSSFQPDFEVESLRYVFTKDEGELTDSDHIIELELTYKDMNGDHEDDLIVSDNPLLAVFIWTGQEYSTPLLIIDCCYNFPPVYSQMAYEDWTSNDIPEIIFDLRGGQLIGTGVGYSYLDRYIIHCNETGCHILWDGTIANQIDCFSSGGMSLFQTDLQQETNNSNELILTSTSGGFAVYECDSMYSYNSLIVYTTTLSSYTWNGSIFEVTTEIPLKEFQIINSQQLLETENDSGIFANIEAVPNDWPYGRNDICQLFIENELVGQPFGCKENFTTVEWLDITNDGQPEIIVVALSGNNPVDQEGNPLSEINCVHQRLFAYQWSDKTAIEIANVAGCVVEDNLYGVKLDDWDDDGQIEIIAAGDLSLGMGYENIIYEWNGSTFEFWDSILAD